MSELFKEDPQLDALVDTAVEEGTFGEDIIGFPLEQLVKLKTLLLLRMKKQENNIPRSVRFRHNINKKLGVNIFPLQKAKDQLKIYETLRAELDQVGSKLREHGKEKEERYAQEFIAYLKSLSPHELGQNLSDWHIKHFLNVGEKQLTPKESQDGKIVISYNESNESNLEFLRANIADAIILKNEKNAPPSQQERLDRDRADLF